MNYIHIGKVLKRAFKTVCEILLRRNFSRRRVPGDIVGIQRRILLLGIWLCIDSNKVVKILKINDVKVAENIEYLDEFNRNEYKYQAKNNNGAKLINGKMFLTDRFSPNLIVCTLTREIVLKKGKVLYTRWGSGKVSQKAEKVIEANIALLKKGRYLIEIQELDGELISVVAQKYSNISNKKKLCYIQYMNKLYNVLGYSTLGRL